MSRGKDLAVDNGIRWKVPFFAIGIGVVAASFLCIAWLPGGLRPIGPLAGIVAGGEFVLGAVLYLFLDPTVFRPADRWTREVSSGAGGVLPARAGALSPPHSAVSARGR